MLRSRRGTSYLVEASLIYPMIVAVTVMLLAAAVYFYGMAAAASDLNRTVRREAGKRSDTVYYNEDDDMKTNRIPVTESDGLLSKKVSAVSRNSYVSSIVFRIRHSDEYKAEAYVISEVDTLWNLKVAKDALGKITGKN